jgi:transposase
MTAKPVQSAKQDAIDARNAEIIKFADAGWSAEEIADHFDLGERLIHRVTEVERARRGAAGLPPPLAMPMQQRLEAAIEREKRKVEVEFLERVRVEVLRRTEDRLKWMDEKEAEAERIIATRKGVMTKAAYRKILFCIHPDRVAALNDPELSRRFGEAFDLVTKLEKLLLDEKESPTLYPPVPHTYAELMEARRKERERRRAARAASKSAVVRPSI